MVILMFLAGVGPRGQPFEWRALVFTFIKGAFLIGALWLVSKYALKRIFAYVASHFELLFLCTMAWALGVSSVFKFLGFSFEIGAFLSGVALANLPYRYSISARIAPIRDFFIIIFFIVLGFSIDFAAVKNMFWEILVFSLFVTIATPIVIANYLGWLGFGKRVAFLSGLALAQVSEFSLIIVVVGARLGHVSSEVVSFISSVAILNIAVSSYLVINGSRIYRLLRNKVKIIERRKTATFAIPKKDLQNHIILVGAEQMGNDILDFLTTKIKETNQSLVVVDFNPAIVESLTAGNVNVIFGDISDPEVLEQLNLSEAMLIITTVPDLVDNINLIKFAKKNGYAGPIIAASYWLHDAIKLYEIGADYVVVPEEVGGKHVARVLSDHWENLKEIKKTKSKHFEELLAHRIF